LLLIGDAATSVDPITAGGMGLALISAELLAKHVHGILGGSRLARLRFEQARAQAVWVHRLLGACLLEIGKRPSAALRARSLMQVCPGWMSALVELAARPAP
jgi:flavin-dependent dehydrogenase